MKDSLSNFLDDLLIVVVLYQQKIIDAKSWTSLMTALPARASVFLFDNGEVSQEVPPAIFNLYYHRSPKNVGVAGAFNAAWHKARQLDKQWILLLDQDTEVSYQLFESFYHSITKFPAIKMFAPILKDKKGVLSPFYFKKGISKRLRKVEEGVFQFENRRVANSGTLVKTMVFDQVNGFDERLPLDYSDIFFQEKISRHNPSFVVVPAQLSHQFSGSENQNFNTSASRFQLFCESCITMASITGNRNNYYLTSLKRAIHLSFIHFSTAFISLHFQKWSRA